MSALITVFRAFESPDCKSVIILTQTLGIIQKQSEHIVGCGYSKTAATKDNVFIGI